jgi:hypothetical protein
VLQARELNLRQVQQQLEAILVVRSDAVYPGSKHQTFGIHQQVPLAAADFLATVVASLLPADASRLRGLGVNIPDAGVRVPAKPRTQVDEAL